MVESIATSSKYRTLGRSAIERVVARHRLGGLRQLEKRARRELHHVLADYHLSSFSAKHLDSLGAALSDGQLGFGPDEQNREALRAACEPIVRWHASSRERFPLLDQGYYDRIFQVTGQPTTVADLASALHPFELPWMLLGPEVRYTAYDLNQRYVDAADLLLGGLGIGDGSQRDILAEPVTDHVDLAFFLMTYHCFEQLRSGAGWEVIRSTPADWIAVSLPRRSLGNRPSQKFERLIDAFEAELAATGLDHHRQDWDTEILYLIAR